MHIADDNNKRKKMKSVVDRYEKPRLGLEGLQTGETRKKKKK
jgi:hypothetical protein